MNRLQKKCVIGAVGIHLLLFLILIVGPAFYNQQPKTDDMQVLDVIPANLVDAAVSSGVAHAQPPPTPVQPRPPQPQQLFAPPPLPKIVQPTPPAPSPSPSLLKEFKDFFAPKPAPSVTPDLTPAEKAAKTHETQDNKIQVDLHKVKRTAQKESSRTDNARAINNELRSLKSSLSSSTKIDMPGVSSESSANYAAAVESIYEQALRSNLPESVAHNNETTTVRVTIANDGTVISSEIISPSGDSAWDNAVQHTLNQVTFIAPFPEGAIEKERHYNINFNPEVEQSLQ